MSTFSAKQMLLEQDILLEAGTNELEVLVFILDGGKFGINVAKVREVISPGKVHKLPQTPDAVEGTFRLREQVVPLIGLRQFLQLPPYTPEQLADPERSRIIVTEFNQEVNAFRVDAVERINRISWEAIQPMPEVSGTHHSPITAVTRIDDQLVLLLDFETIIDRIHTFSKLRTGRVENSRGVDRPSKRIAMAEDSVTVRQLMRDSMTASDYTNIEMFGDGAAIWQWLRKQADDPNSPDVDLVISDIEMPQIDGLHLTKLIREHPKLKDVPVMLFSSLITPSNLKKGEAVGATSQISKPDLFRLVEIVDELFDSIKSK